MSQQPQAGCDLPDTPAPTAGPVTCERCGLEAAPAEGDPPLAWSCDRDSDGEHWVCPVCTRDNVRSIEGKLDQTWWEA